MVVAKIGPTIDQNLFLAERHGRKQKHFSLKGGFALALRRNIGNVAARTLGATILEDVSHQSVVRYEIEFHGAIVAAHRAHISDELVACSQSPQQTLLVHAFRGDATNSNVWRQAKLHGVQCTSTFVHNTSMIDNCSLYMQSKTTYTAWADPQRVEDGTAAAMHGMFRKQLAGLGIRCWPSGDQVADAFAVDDDPAAFVRHIKSKPRPAHLSLWLITSDGGGDQMKFRKIVKQDSGWRGWGGVQHRSKLKK